MPGGSGAPQPSGGGKGAAIQAGASFLGGLFGGRAADKRRAKEALLNRQFQERMSSTAFQRQAIDLEKAGLNRILGLSGSGASSPGGSMAAQQDYITPAINTALAARIQNAQIKKITAETNLTETKEDVIRPAAIIGETVGGWLHNIKHLFKGETMQQFLQDMQISGVPHSARQIPLEVEVTKGSKQQTPAEKRWLERYKKGAKGSHKHTRKK